MKCGLTVRGPTEGTHLKVCVPSQNDVSVSFNLIYTGYISLAIFSMMIHVVEQLQLILAGMSE